MPLPPLPANNTDRYWLKYTWGGIEHEVCFRLANSTSSADGQAFAAAFATAMKPYIKSTDSFSALRKSENGSTVSFPLTFTPQVGSSGATVNDLTRAGFVALAGRSSGGYRCKITFFCGGALDNNDYRGTTATVGPQKALWDVVQAASPVLCSVEGTGVIWNAYVNQGWNAYWQRQFR